jgi:hypothetical protein
MKENERRAIAGKGEALPHNGEAEPPAALFAPFGARAIPDGARQLWVKPAGSARHFVCYRNKLFTFNNV